jgi:hypothetical protein
MWLGYFSADQSLPYFDDGGAEHSARRGGGCGCGDFV